MSRMRIALPVAVSLACLAALPYRLNAAPVATPPPAATGPVVVSATPPEATSVRARVIVKYKADSPLLRKQALSVAAQQAEQAEALARASASRCAPVPAFPSARRWCSPTA